MSAKKVAATERSFYKGKTIEVAKNLLGEVLVRHVEPTKSGPRGKGVENEVIKKGIIVETEAYLGPEDLACHSSRGRTKRTEVMFGPAGHAYVYLVYGMHYMFNIVTEAPGEAVLVRALDPLVMVRALKGVNISEIATSTARSDRKIAAGPGKLSKWLEIDNSLNGWDLTKGKRLWVEKGVNKDFEIAEAKRVGVDYAEEWADKPFRFYIKNNCSVSTA